MTKETKREEKLCDWKKPELVELNIEKDTKTGGGPGADTSTES